MIYPDWQPDIHFKIIAWELNQISKNGILQFDSMQYQVLSLKE